MAKAQTVADLKINLKADLGNLEFLRKDLKQISKESKLADKSFEGLVAEIKNLGKATEKTTYGLKGQIAAFEKLRDRAAFQGKAYKELTREIVNMNKALVNRLDIERKLGTEGNKGVRKPGADVTAGLLASTYFTDSSRRKTGSQAEFADRISKLQMLMYARTFESLTDRQQEFLKGITTTKQGYLDQRKLKGTGFTDAELQADKTRALTYWAEKGKYTGTPISPMYDMSKFKEPGALNELQLKALGLKSSDLDIKSKDYLDVLTKINAEEGNQSKILSQQELRSRADIANKKARTIATNKLADAQIRFNQSEAYQLYKGALRTKPPTEGLTKDFAPQNMDAKLPKLRKFLEQPQWVRKLQGFLDFGMGLKSRQYKDVEAELGTGDFFAKYKRTQRGGIGDIYRPESLASFLRPKTGRIDDSYEQLLGKKGDKAVFSTGGTKRQIDAMIARQGKVKREDFFGLGADLGYPMTPRGQQSLIGDLQDTLQDLTPGTENYKTVKEELTRVTERWLKVNEKANKSLKDAQKEYAGLSKKALPAAGQTGKKGGALAVYDPKFAAQQSSGLQQTVESLDQYLDRVRKGTKAQNLNINSLTKQRSKLDEIRNGLDPTTVAFKKATQAISTTDKALSRLNNNKFSGRNLGRTAQSILGASFFGGPAGFLGSTLGAGVEALRPGGDTAQGAVTGGLVASQVLQPVAAFGAESANYTAMIEKSKIALQAATRIEGDAIASKEAYAVALSTAAGVTERFNVPQELAARGMTRLSAAVIGAGGNIHNAGIAFENISAAIKATGGSTEDTKAAITAMVQIFSKGKVSAEELSGQLGERFPAAVTLFAEANNMTTKELQKGLKDGAIGLDKLWNFVLKLGDKYKDVAEGIGAASVEAGVRSQIAWNEVKLAVGKALQPIGADLQVIGAEILTNLVPVLKFAAQVLGGIGRAVSFTAKAVVENFDKLILVVGTFSTTVIFANRVALAQFIKTLTVKLVAALKGVAASMGLTSLATKGFTGAMAAANKAVIAFTASLLKNPIIAVGTGMAIAASAAWHFGRQWQRTVKEIKDGKMTINEAKIEIAELEQALAGEEDSQARAKLQTQIEMYKAAVKAKQEINKRANLEEASAFDSATPGDTSKWKEVNEYIAELGLGGKHIQDVFINAFKGMEDSLVSFVTTGKLKFKEFARSVIADIARMIIKQMMFNMISGFMNRITGGSASLNSVSLGRNATKMTGIPSGSALPYGSFGIDKTFGTGIPTKPVAGSFGISTIKRPENHHWLNPGGAFTDDKGISGWFKKNALGNAYGKNGIVPFYKGGVVNRPTIFPFSRGVGLMGEAGPEAIIPLKRGKGGRLGVEGGGGTTVNVSVDAKGTNVEGDEGQAKGLGKVLAVAIKAEISKQQRPGGMLYR